VQNHGCQCNPRPKRQSCSRFDPGRRVKQQACSFEISQINVIRRQLGQSDHVDLITSLATNGFMQVLQIG
jgi:hypothetical protein